MRIVAFLLLTIITCYVEADNTTAFNRIIDITTEKQLPNALLSRAGEKLKKLKTKKLNKSVRLFSPQITDYSQESISIALSDTLTVNAAKKNIHHKKHGTLIWRGSIISKMQNSILSPAKGKILLAINKGRISGSIRFEKQLYRIQPIEQEIHGVIHIDESELPPDHPPNTNFDSTDNIDVFSGQSSANTDAPLQSNTTVRVLVAYTPAVAAAAGDVTTLSDLAIAETNDIYLNSGLNGNINMELATLVQVNYTEPALFTSILTQLRSTNDAIMDEIHQLRLDNSADIVVLLVDQDQYCGMGAINADFANAFAVVHYTCATGYYSFAHEIGHLHGARHNVEQDPINAPYNHGHGYLSPAGSFRTVMAYDCPNNCPRVAHWSNPEITITNEVSGIVGESNVARVIRDTAFRVANLFEFRDLGQESWYFDVGDRVYSSPALDFDGTVYFGSRNGYLYALNNNGTLKWSFDTASGITGSPTVAGNNVYIRTYNLGTQYLYSISALDGLLQWSLPASSSASSPAIGNDGTVYINDGLYLLALQENGTEIWRLNLGSSMYGSPVVMDDGTIVAAMGVASAMHKISANGTLIWTYNSDTPFREAPALGANGEIYAVSTAGIVHSVSRDGLLLWTFDTGASVFSTGPVLDGNNNIIIGVSNGTLYSIDQNGLLNWSAVYDSSIASTALISSNNTVLVSANSGLHAINVTNGTLLWKTGLYTTGQSAPVLGNDGMLYIGDANFTNGGLHAIRASNAGEGIANTPWPMKLHDSNHTSRMAAPLSPNRPPLVSISSPLNGTQYSLDLGPLSLSGSATDFEDGDLSAFIEWTSDLDGILFSPVLLSVGAHTITASVDDSGALNATDSVSITVTPGNQAPTVNIQSPLNGETFSIDDGAITFVALASDAEDGDLSSNVSYLSSIDGTFTSPALLSVGTHVITGSVTDSGGLSAADAISITINPANQMPTISFQSPLNGTTFSEDDGPISISVLALDPEEGDISANAVLNSNLDGPIVSPVLLSVGVHIITATITDSGGLNNSNSISITILAHVNQAPMVSILSPTSGSTLSVDDGPVAFIVDATDLEQGDISTLVELTSNLDGVIGNPATLSPGTHTITAGVSDNQGLYASDTVVLTVTPHINAAPVLNILTPTDGATFTEGESIVLQATAIDAEEGDISGLVTWESSIAGTINSPVLLSVGVHTITARVSDANGAQASSVVNINVNAAGPKLLTDVLSNVSNTAWTNVTLANYYQSMVVIASVQNDKNAAPLVVRIRNAIGNQFDVQVQRADNLTDPVTNIRVHYVIAEEGTYTQAVHGITMEAVKVSSTTTANAKSWISEVQNYANNYVNPVVVGQVMSTNDAAFSVFWSQGNTRQNAPSSTALSVGKHVGEDSNSIRADETIAYMVIETGQGTTGDYNYIAALGSDTIRGIDNGIYNYTISGLISPTSAIISQAAMDGANGGWAILSATNPLSSTAIQISIDEDRMKDSERKHSTEQVAYIVFEKITNP